MLNSDTYIALLRGINVGGRNVVQMKALRELLTSMGCRDVQSYIQSGNLVFRSTRAENELCAKLSVAIHNAFGLQVPVVIRSQQQLQAILADNPFLLSATSETNSASLHVGLLAAEPDAELVQQVPANNKEDRCVIRGCNVYLHCPNGYARCKFGNTFLEKKLQQTCTTRNWKTLNKLLAMAG